jgi:hypothetical protein
VPTPFRRKSSPPLTRGGEASTADIAWDFGILEVPCPGPLAEGRRRQDSLASARAGDPQALGFRFIPDDLRGGPVVRAAAGRVRPRRGTTPEPREAEPPSSTAWSTASSPLGGGAEPAVADRRHRAPHRSRGRPALKSTTDWPARCGLGRWWAEPNAPLSVSGRNRPAGVRRVSSRRNGTVGANA